MCNKLRKNSFSALRTPQKRDKENSRECVYALSLLSNTRVFESLSSGAIAADEKSCCQKSLTLIMPILYTNSTLLSIIRFENITAFLLAMTWFGGF